MRCYNFYFFTGTAMVTGAGPNGRLAGGKEVVMTQIMRRKPVQTKKNKMQFVLNRLYGIIRLQSRICQAGIPLSSLGKNVAKETRHCDILVDANVTFAINILCCLRVVYG